ncbi:hypothetical protein C900_00491 [Fulvivirga imtechensis AK7]|uniref:DinB family protein n=1 Tax=Fulvivirga imtechensis AK7 TaxID=1237149 RepID=L8JZA5_9BACT|nr:DinB family protein [Fulvivirga imtechensis]ELR72989.1 hypothetical protein C900_00491 [Fulvivirga imtechensis AK7]
MEHFHQQYELIRGSREVVFDYCERLIPQHFVEEINQQGASLRHLQVHIANVYIHWLANFSMKKNTPYFDVESIKDITSVRQVFTKVDKLVAEFLRQFPEGDTCISGVLPGRDKMEFGALTVFTHVVTHEFHHKGQMMTMLRHLGYPPPDADVIRF